MTNLTFELARRLKAGPVTGYLGKGGSAKAPDYNQIAVTQGQQNRETAGFNTRINRPNISTPFGSQSWTKQGNTWTLNQDVTPQTQQLIDAIQNSQVGASGALGSLGGQAGNSLSQPLDWSGIALTPEAKNIDTSGLPSNMSQMGGIRQDISDAMYQNATRYLDDQSSRQEEALRTRLANEGFTNDSAGMGNSMRDFYRANNEQYANARNQAILAGQNATIQDLGALSGALGTKAGIEGQNYNQQMQTHQQNQADMLLQREAPLNEYASLLSALAPQLPQFQSFYTGAGATPVDLQSAGQNQYQAAQNALNAKTAGAAAGVSGAADLIGSGAKLYSALYPNG